MKPFSFTSVFLVALTLFAGFRTRAQSGQWLQVEDFGSNPGKAEMFLYTPPGDSLVEMPLVVAIHGCNQSAEALASQSGWLKLADEQGFMILFPQQRLVNNMSRCWNWFQEDDMMNERGELGSIRQMVDYATGHYPVDTAHIHVYGVSSGGAMANALLAHYPELFASGCIYAGGPFGLVDKPMKAMKQMTSPRKVAPSHLANAITSLHNSPPSHWPDITVIHGKIDPVVHPDNGIMVCEQWVAVMELDRKHPHEATIDGRADLHLTQWNDRDGRVHVQLLEIDKMMHCLAVDPGTGECQGGEISIFSYDFDFHSTWWVAQQMNLIRK